MNAERPTARKRAARTKPIHHAADFGLDVMSGDDDLFRWFLLAFLLGKPIQSTVAVRTWRLFVDQKLDFPWAILDASDRTLVHTFHRGGYTRYQHVMGPCATYLHAAAGGLVRGLAFPDDRAE